MLRPLVAEVSCSKIFALQLTLALKGGALRVQFSLSGKVLEPRPRHAFLCDFHHCLAKVGHYRPHPPTPLTGLPYLFPCYTDLAVDTG